MLQNEITSALNDPDQIKIKKNRYKRLWTFLKMKVNKFKLLFLPKHGVKFLFVYYLFFTPFIHADYCKEAFLPLIMSDGLFSVVPTCYNSKLSSDKITRISTFKKNYNEREPIRVRVTNMSGKKDDWVAIYPIGADIGWENIVAWKFTRGINGNINLGKIPAGNYEVRAFFGSPYQIKSKYTFSVTSSSPNITTSKEDYNENESVKVVVKNVDLNISWVAIYPIGASNSWNNIVAWKFTKDMKNNGSLDLGTIHAGDYEARVFEGKYNLKSSYTFSVYPTTNSGKAKIFIIGDSTVYSNQVEDENMGWGSKLGEYVKNKINIFNRAQAGSSSKSYKVNSSDNHDWRTTKKLMSQADCSNGAYLFIQFGHNDNTKLKDTRYTYPGRPKDDNKHYYYNELKKYVDYARKIGVTPILITPVSRLKTYRTHGDYPQTMKYLASDENVTLLDLESESFSEFRNTVSSGQYFIDAITHFNEEGAKKVAGWVKELACEKNKTLCNQFKE